MPWQAIVWILLIAIALAFQLHTVTRSDGWPSMRWLDVRSWGRVFVFPAFTWLTWHWLIQTPEMTMFYGLFAILVGLLPALILNYDDRERAVRRVRQEQEQALEQWREAQAQRRKDREG
jgi:hypothetical protein